MNIPQIAGVLPAVIFPAATFMHLLRKVRTFDEKQAQKLVADRNYAALDQMVIEHLLGK